MATNTVKEISKEDVLKKQIADLEFEKKALADKVNELEKTIESIRNTNNDSINEAKNELDKTKKEYQDLVAEFNNLKEFSDRRVRELEKALTLLNSLHSNIASTMDLAKANIDSLLKEVQS